MVNLGGAKAFSPHSILFQQTDLQGTKAKFLKAQTLSNLARGFHNDYLPSSCGRGKDWTAAQWRHCSASLLHGLGRTQEAIDRLEHESEPTFRAYYELPLHPGFTLRWHSYGPAAREKLTPDELFLV